MIVALIYSKFTKLVLLFRIITLLDCNFTLDFNNKIPLTYYKITNIFKSVDIFRFSLDMKKYYTVRNLQKFCVTNVVENYMNLAKIDWNF